MPITEVEKSQAIQGVVDRLSGVRGLNELSLQPRTDLTRQLLLTELPDTTAAELTDEELATISAEAALRFLGKRNIQ